MRRFLATPFFALAWIATWGGALCVVLLTALGFIICPDWFKRPK